MLEPGQGYRLHMDDTDGAGVAAGTLEWPASYGFLDAGYRTAGPAADGLVNIEEAALNEGAAWPMNVRELESSMSMIVRLVLPAEHPQGMADMLGAFITDENTGEMRCIGQVLPMDTDAGLLYFLSVFGDATDVDFTRDDAVSFRWRSALTDLEYPADELGGFEAGVLKGTLDDPFILNFSKAQLASEVTAEGGLVAYPNPFRDELTIHWHGEAQVKQLRIESASGQLVEMLDCDNLQSGPCRWVAGALPAGVYFIHAVTDAGNFSVRVVK
jgi:hypothetical protein